MGRYSIYNFIGSEIEFVHKSEKVSGLCQDVTREILENKIFITVNDRIHCFSEPHKIDEEDGNIVFLYGSEQTEDLVDFCGENYSVHWGEDIRKSVGREKAFVRVIFKIKETIDKQDKI